MKRLMLGLIVVLIMLLPTGDVQADTTITPTDIDPIGWASSAAYTVTISGPETGEVNTAYTFTATFGFTDTVVLPLSYSWEATGQAPLQHSGAGLTDTATFTWTVTGPQLVTVTVGNTQILAGDQHTITIQPHQIFLPLVLRSWPPYPHTPTLSAISNTDGDGAYTVSWVELPTQFATSYVLQEATDAAFTTGLRTVCTTANQNCQVTGRIAGTYYYRVKGQNVWGESAWSNTQTVVVLPSATPVLNAINNADGDGSYTVSWNAAARATSYTLQEDTDSSFGSPTTVFNGSQTSWSASGRTIGTYYYRVIATGPTGQSGWSTTQSAVVLSPATPVLNAIDNADGDGSYSVTWNAAARATSYTLQEDTNASFSSPTTVFNGAHTSWSASGKAVGTYYYRVIANGPTGQSGWSATQSVSVRPPNAPYLNPISNADGDGNYNVTWNAVPGATSYTLQEDDNSGFSSPQTLYTGANQSWSAVNHVQGTYYYRVAAVGPTGQSAWSNSQTATISPPADVRITYIEYDPPGDDVQGEYVRIQNLGGRAQVMTGWTLRDVANHVFTFPSFTLAAGGTVRVWTKVGTNTATDLYWGSAAAIWNNTGDTAYLRDAGGALVSSYTYP